MRERSRPGFDAWDDRSIRAFDLTMQLRGLELSIGGIHADVIVYIFAHLHTALLTEIDMLDMN